MTWLPTWMMTWLSTGQWRGNWCGNDDVITHTPFKNGPKLGQLFTNSLFCSTSFSNTKNSAHQNLPNLSTLITKQVTTHDTHNFIKLQIPNHIHAHNRSTVAHSQLKDRNGKPEERGVNGSR
jgi:hypothetical protein